MTIHIYTTGRGCVAVVRRGGREVWRSVPVPAGRGGIAWAMARRWIKGER
jgi:hypothetical protein